MRRNKYLSIIAVILCSVLILAGCGTTTKEETSTSIENSEETVELTIFIAASLTNVMGTIKDMYEEKESNINIIYNADSSGTLRTQIEEGATCDIFFSAAMNKMDSLTEGGYVDTETVVQLLENKVVLIKSTGVETAVTGFDNITDASNIALAGADVPVGQYARDIFQNMGTYDSIMAMEVNECANVTTVLTSVSEQSNEVGVTYSTDAASMLDSVEIIAYAPEGSLETPVVYPVGLVYNSEATEAEVAAAMDFIEFLQTDEAISVFEEYGFVGYKK
jgi:molybdate transport system substrate-binding protein